ncbi:MAG: hybrid sensor histidine kinase/response regulator, partial [Acidocella sp. 20-61-6]
TAIIAALLSLTGFEYGNIDPAHRPIINETLLVVFLILFILSALAAWLLVLAHTSRRAAEVEITHQTTMLMEEIAAHEKIDTALEKAKAAAEAANTAKSRYLVGVIHEIRAPLNAIFGYAQLLENSSSLRPEDAVRTIRRSAEHLSNMVDGLLDISQIETGSLQLHRDLVNFPEFLDQIVDMFKLQAAAKRIGFFHERIGYIPEFIYTDEKRLRQILINLLSNAVKYTDLGSATLRIQIRGQVTEFEVIDTGHGIRPEDIDTIFEPFERGHMAATNAMPGTGLGLTISKLLTQILGGEISVESSPGEGSRFRVRLLLSEARDILRPQTERRITAYENTRRHVLMVDDDHDHLDLLTEILQPLGFTVTTAPDGSSCLNIFDSHKFDLVILDIAMPGLSGLEVAAQIKSRSSHTKILIVSGNFHDAKRLSGPTSAKCYDAFLTKPIDIKALLTKIKNLLGLNWIYEVPPLPATLISDPLVMTRPERRHLLDLLQLGQIGYIRGIEAKLDEIIIVEPETLEFCDYLRTMIRAFELHRYNKCLEQLPELIPHE